MLLKLLQWKNKLKLIWKIIQNGRLKNKNKGCFNMKTKVLKSLSVCGLALSLFAAGQSTITAHNFAHADGPATTVGSGTIATGKVLLQGNNGKVSLVEEVSSEGSKSTVKFFLGDKPLPGFDKDANILAQGSDGVVLEEPTTHAIAIVQKSQDGSALDAYTGVELAPFIQSIKDKAAQNKNIIYDHIDTKDFTVDNKKFTVPFLQTEIAKIDDGVTVLKNGIGCSYTTTTSGTNVMDNVGATMNKEVPSKYSIAKNNDVTVDYQGNSHTYTQNLLSFDQSGSETDSNKPASTTDSTGSAVSDKGTQSSSTAKDQTGVSSDKKPGSSTSASVSKSDDKTGTDSVNSDKANNADTKTDKDSISSTTAANGDKSSAKIDKLDDASSKAESGVAGQKSSVADGQASGESSSIKSGSISGKSDGASAKSASLSVSSSSVKSSGTESGSGESGSADKIAGQSSSIASSQESSQLSSASSSENGASNGTGSGTAVGGQAGSNGFEANGNNQGSGNEAGTPASTQPGGDDTYSPQKAAMLAKTNAKVAESGIVAAIGAAIGTVAGWFGLKKKN